MKLYKTFIFDSYKFDVATKTVSLRYSYDDELFFEETIEFPLERQLDNIELEILDTAFKYLHLSAGVSYYKLFLPYSIEVRTMELDSEQADFFNTLYRKGLGEFSYKNKIMDLWDRIKFPSTGQSRKNPNLDFKLAKRLAIPIGGGKDSIVTLETIKNHYRDEDIVLCSTEKAPAVTGTIAASSCKNYFYVKRTISKQLLDLNKKLDEIGGYSGHIPIGGIIAFILLAAGIVYGFSTILMSNERSANVGNVYFNGTMVNHQWSKSFEFEKSMNSFIKKYVLRNFNYISFLRPISEIHIVKIFSRLEKYHKLFMSCNKNFRIENRLNGWCCDCDKCRFVFLALAVFMDKNSLTNIFGADLLDVEGQLGGFLELCGLENHRPFECVGEIEESVYAMLNVHRSFRDDFAVKKIQNLLGDYDVANLENKLFTPTSEHLLSEDMFNMLNEVL
ncbi:MAG: hypothetical protein LBP39_01615 [Rickettsiales bacterium]|jgi:hypothetical protein|nr:hypothetical protein [Rickettsiales bacterium]